MNNQKNYSRKDNQCENCTLYSDHHLYLSCGHRVCVKCVAFSYHKYSHTLKNPSIIRCLICQQVSELTDKDLRAINNFTNQFLIPLVRQDEKHTSKNKESQFGFTPSDLSSGNKQLKSLQQSIEKNTPMNRGFYSKCQSPKANFPNALCLLHPDQELSIVCFTCNNTLLCTSCLSIKKHNSHNMKTISKGLETIQQKIALTCLKSKEFINRLEMTKRRLEDRRELIQDRWEKSINSLKLHFNNLLDLVNKKCDEIVEGYSNIFEKAIEDLALQGKKVQNSLKHSKKQLQKLIGISKTQTNPIDIIKKSTFIMQQMSEMKEPQIQTAELASYDTDKIVRDIVFLCEKVEKMDSQNYHFPTKYQPIQNYKSQEKNKDNFYKRIKTNIISLNSSRDKKEKKGTKTQEDEKRNKSKAAYKGESSSKIQKVNKALPTYLLQHLDKSSKNLQIAQCLAQLNPLQSSLKSTSKILSKSHIPSAFDQNRKKKQHIAYIKQCLQRKERKTFNGNSKELKGGNQCMKKKKIPN